jgi:hypothetical protein
LNRKKSLTERELQRKLRKVCVNFFPLRLSRHLSLHFVKRLIQSARLNSVPARWPEPNAGVARHVGGSHAYAEASASIFGSWFFGSFVSRQKNLKIQLSHVKDHVRVLNDIDFF